MPRKVQAQAHGREAQEESLGMSREISRDGRDHHLSVKNIGDQLGVPWWVSENSLRVLQGRYFLKREDGSFAEDTNGLIDRVCKNVAHIDGLWEHWKNNQDWILRPDIMEDESIHDLHRENKEWAPLNDPYWDVYSRARTEYELMLRSGDYVPSTPILINSGCRSGMLYSCFVLPMDDSLFSDEENPTGIFDCQNHVCAVQRSGGGTGVSVSRTRPRDDVILRGAKDGTISGHTPGSVTWLELISDAVKHIEQGSTRHGANMGILRVDHPDIIEFILSKDGTRLTNFNISVGMTNAFIDQLERKPDTPWLVKNPRTLVWEPCRDKLGKVMPPESEWTVRDVWKLIVKRAWETGDPGLWFIDRVNSHHQYLEILKTLFEACNPCGEQELLPFESCNLGSIALSRFITWDGIVDWTRMEWTVKKAVRFHDGVIDANIYTPEVPQIREATKLTRKIGIGVMGWWDFLVKQGIPYESEEALDMAENVMSKITRWAEEASRDLAVERGPWPGWKSEPGVSMMRNATLTTIAPTGTISIIAGDDVNSGIEPVFAIAYVQNTPGTGGAMKVVNGTFKEYMQRTRPSPVDDDYIFTVNQIISGVSTSNCSRLSEKEKALFKSANEIAVEWHILHQQAFQKHTHNSVSKTINLNRNASVKDVERAYKMAMEGGVNGITVFRDGCLPGQQQPISFEEKKEPTADDTAKWPAVNWQMQETEKDDREEAPFIKKERVMSSKPQHGPAPLRAIKAQLGFDIKSIFGSVHLSLTVDPRREKEIDCELEVFGWVGKGGDLSVAHIEGLGRLASHILRHGGSVELLAEQLTGIGSRHTILSAGGRHLSLEDSIGYILSRYIEAKKKWGLKALLLCEVPDEEVLAHMRGGREKPSLESSIESLHGLTCSAITDGVVCGGRVEIIQGCATCMSCGASTC